MPGSTARAVRGGRAKGRCHVRRAGSAVGRAKERTTTAALCPLPPSPWNVVDSRNEVTVQQAHNRTVSHRERIAG